MMKHFRRIRITTFLVLLLGGMAFGIAAVGVQAQGISPVIQEFNKKARGAFQVTNVGDAAKIVSCKAQGFDPNEHGTPQLHSLDPMLHVRIDAERVMLAPRGSRQVSFDATPSTLPAWFAVTCRFMPVDRGPGLTLAMEITSLVIIHGGAFNSEAVELTAKRVGTTVEAVVMNNGPGLARVSSGEVLGNKKQADLTTFLLFPHQRRLVEADWKEPKAPEIVRLQIGKHRLEAPVY